MSIQQLAKNIIRTDPLLSSIASPVFSDNEETRHQKLRRGDRISTPGSGREGFARDIGVTPEIAQGTSNLFGTVGDFATYIGDTVKEDAEFSKINQNTQQSVGVNVNTRKFINEVLPLYEDIISLNPSNEDEINEYNIMVQNLNTVAKNSDVFPDVMGKNKFDPYKDWNTLTDTITKVYQKNQQSIDTYRINQINKQKDLQKKQDVDQFANFLDTNVKDINERTTWANPKTVGSYTYSIHDKPEVINTVINNPNIRNIYVNFYEYKNAIDNISKQDLSGRDWVSLQKHKKNLETFEEQLIPQMNSFVSYVVDNVDKGDIETIFDQYKKEYGVSPLSFIPKLANEDEILINPYWNAGDVIMTQINKVRSLDKNAIKSIWYSVSDASNTIFNGANYAANVLPGIITGDLTPDSLYASDAYSLRNIDNELQKKSKTATDYYRSVIQVLPEMGAIVTTNTAIDKVISGLVGAPKMLSTLKINNIKNLSNINPSAYVNQKIIEFGLKNANNNLIQSAMIQGIIPTEYTSDDLVFDIAFSVVDAGVDAVRTLNKYKIDKARYPEAFKEELSKRLFTISEPERAVLSPETKKHVADTGYKLAVDFSNKAKNTNPQVINALKDTIIQNNKEVSDTIKVMVKDGNDRFISYMSKSYPSVNVPRLNTDERFDYYKRMVNEEFNKIKDTKYKESVEKKIREDISQAESDTSFIDWQIENFGNVSRDQKESLDRLDTFTREMALYRARLRPFPNEITSINTRYPVSSPSTSKKKQTYVTANQLKKNEEAIAGAQSTKELRDAVRDGADYSEASNIVPGLKENGKGYYNFITDSDELSVFQKTALLVDDSGELFRTKNQILPGQVYQKNGYITTNKRPYFNNVYEFDYFIGEKGHALIHNLSEDRKIWYETIPGDRPIVNFYDSEDLSNRVFAMQLDIDYESAVFLIKNDSPYIYKDPITEKNVFGDLAFYPVDNVMDVSESTIKSSRSKADSKKKIQKLSRDIQTKKQIDMVNAEKEIENQYRKTSAYQAKNKHNNFSEKLEPFVQQVRNAGEFETESAIRSIAKQEYKKTLDNTWDKIAVDILDDEKLLKQLIDFYRDPNFGYYKTLYDEGNHTVSRNSSESLVGIRDVYNKTHADGKGKLDNRIYKLEQRLGRSLSPSETKKITDYEDLIKSSDDKADINNVIDTVNKISPTDSKRQADRNRLLSALYNYDKLSTFKKSKAIVETLFPDINSKILEYRKLYSPEQMSDAIQQYEYRDIVEQVQKTQDPYITYYNIKEYGDQIETLAERNPDFTIEDVQDIMGIRIADFDPDHASETMKLYGLGDKPLDFYNPSYIQIILDASKEFFETKNRLGLDGDDINNMWHKYNYEKSRNIGKKQTFEEYIKDTSNIKQPKTKYDKVVYAKEKSLNSNQQLEPVLSFLNNFYTSDSMKKSSNDIKKMLQDSKSISEISNPYIYMMGTKQGKMLFLRMLDNGSNIPKQLWDAYYLAMNRVPEAYELYMKNPSLGKSITNNEIGLYKKGSGKYGIAQDDFHPVRSANGFLIGESGRRAPDPSKIEYAVLNNPEITKSIEDKLLGSWEKRKDGSYVLKDSGLPFDIAATRMSNIDPKYRKYVQSSVYGGSGHVFNRSQFDRTPFIASEYGYTGSKQQGLPLVISKYTASSSIPSDSFESSFVRFLSETDTDIGSIGKTMESTGHNALLDIMRETYPISGYTLYKYDAPLVQSMKGEPIVALWGGDFNVNNRVAQELIQDGYRVIPYNEFNSRRGGVGDYPENYIILEKDVNKANDFYNPDIDNVIHTTEGIIDNVDDYLQMCE